MMCSDILYINSDTYNKMCLRSEKAKKIKNNAVKQHSVKISPSAFWGAYFKKPINVNGP